MIGHKHIPSREGGIEVVVEELSTRMVKLGHSVTCFNRKGRHVSGGEIEKLKEYKGVNIKEVFTLQTEFQRHSATSGTEATARWSRSGMPLRMRRTARTF